MTSYVNKADYLEEEYRVTSVECGEDNAQKAYHGNSAIDKLCIATKDLVSLSWQSFEDWYRRGQSEEEEGEDDGYGKGAELLEQIFACGKLCSNGCEDSKHC